MSQEQCPDCGGYKITYQGDNPGCAFSFAILFGLFLLIIPNMAGWGILELGFTVVMGVVWVFWANTHRECLICGKEWVTDTYTYVEPEEYQEAASSPKHDIPDLLVQLAKLRDSGAISADEFEAKKRELLARL